MRYDSGVTQTSAGKMSNKLSNFKFHAVMNHGRLMTADGRTKPSERLCQDVNIEAAALFSLSTIIALTLASLFHQEGPGLFKQK